MIDTIRSRLVAAFAIVLVGLLITGLLAMNSLRDLSDELEWRLGSVRAAETVSDDLQRAVLDIVLTGEGYLVHGREETRRRFSAAAARARVLVGQARAQSNLSAGERREIERLGELVDRLATELTRGHRLRDEGRRDEARRQVDAVHPVAEELAQVIGAVAHRQAAALDLATERLQERSRRQSNTVLVIVIVAFILGAGLVMVTVRSVDRPLARLVYAAGQLGNGDLRTRVGDGRMPREFTAVGEAFDTMATRLRGLATEVIRTAGQVSSSATDFSTISEQIAASTHEMSTAVSEISGGAQHQAETLKETASAVGELRRGATAIETETAHNRELSESIRAEASHSRAEVQRAVDLLLALREVVHRTGNEVAALEEASAAVTGFVERIASIAQQTHLLALNAAIEAARAGEEGRGFGVVAEEVRKLAAEADRAAGDVGEVVVRVREQVAAAVETMRQGETQVRQVEEVAHTADDALGAITSGLERIADVAGQVTETVERSLKLLEDVARHVQSVAQMATAHAARSHDVTATVEEQTAATQQIAASAAELVTAAEALRHVIAEWQV